MNPSIAVRSLPRFSIGCKLSLRWRLLLFVAIGTGRLLGQAPDSVAGFTLINQGGNPSVRENEGESWELRPDGTFVTHLWILVNEVPGAATYGAGRRHLHLRQDLVQPGQPDNEPQRRDPADIGAFFSPQLSQGTEFDNFITNPLFGPGSFFLTPTGGASGARSLVNVSVSIAAKRQTASLDSSSSEVNPEKYSFARSARAWRSSESSVLPPIRFMNSRVRTSATAFPARPPRPAPMFPAFPSAGPQPRLPVRPLRRKMPEPEPFLW